jgi:exonuclease III
VNTHLTTFLTWNILHGGGPTRLPEIILAILAHAPAPDVIALSEFRATRGSSIRAALADQGLSHQLVTPNTSGNGLLLASKFPILADRPPLLTPWGRGRWLDATIPALHLDLLAVHIPDDTMRTAKPAFWQEVIAWARPRRTTNAIILGDMNTGRRWHDLPADSAPTACEALLGTLLSLGFADAWRIKHPHSREASWSRSPSTAQHPDSPGLRIDAAYLSPPLRESLISADFSQEERARRLSDHAPLLVRLATPTPRPPAVITLNARKSTENTTPGGLFG